MRSASSSPSNVDGSSEITTPNIIPAVAHNSIQDADDGKVCGWTPINPRKSCLSVSTSPPSLIAARETAPLHHPPPFSGKSPDINDSNNSNHRNHAGNPGSENPTTEISTTRKRKPVTQSGDDPSSGRKKRRREHGKGFQIIEEGHLATNPCQKCSLTGKTCLVPKDPKEMATFKCGHCIKGQMGCSLSASNPGRDDYDVEYVRKSLERLGKTANAKKSRAVAMGASNHAAKEPAKRVIIVVEPEEVEIQERPARTPLPTSRPKKIP